MKVDYIFHITPEASETIQKVAETLAQAIASDKQLKKTSVDEAKDSAKDLGVGESNRDSTKESASADQGKLNIEFNFGKEFESITKILDEKLKAFFSPAYHVPYGTNSKPDQEVIKGICSSLAVYHSLFNEVITIQEPNELVNIQRPQANVLVIDRFAKADPTKQHRYILKVSKARTSSYELKVELNNFTVYFHFVKERMEKAVRALVRTIVTSSLID